jgi:oligopeptide transport system substrate-binding protein
MSHKRDFRTAPAFGTFFPSFNTRKAPFDNVLVRYAFNMALDKRVIARAIGAGRLPANSLVPPLPGYTQPASLVVRLDDRAYDVLQFNPEQARQLLAKAGFPNGSDKGGRQLTVDLLSPPDQFARFQSEILQNQWQEALSVNVRIVLQEFNVRLQNVFSLNYTGITGYGDWGFYLDPNWFLDQFVAGSGVNPSGWSEPEYDAMLGQANATLDPALRSEKLAACEEYLLRAMPFIPVLYDVWAYPQKPYVRGTATNIMDIHSFKYAWIDTKWRHTKL